MLIRFKTADRFKITLLVELKFTSKVHCFQKIRSLINMQC